MPEVDQGDLDRIHERLDDLFGKVGEIQTSIGQVKERCGPCNAKVNKHEDTLYGNGKLGLVTRMSAAETGRVDTLSIKGMITLIGAIGALAGAIGAAMGALIH
jgi:hypothetical protein